MDIVSIIAEERRYFKSGATLSLKTRKENLSKIRDLLGKYRSRFEEAFLKDYNKSSFDVLSTELYLVLKECDYQISHLKRLSRPRKVKTSLVNFPSKGYLLQEPYGVTLIMAPWNYPLQLALEPLMGAIAAGNCCVIKPASYAAHVSGVIFDLFQEFGNPGLISVVLGGREENQTLLDQHFDYIFFTGSKAVGRVVLEKASVYLTPVSLELGGKSPCIVDKDADVDLAAKRIVWGKFLNAGMTCVAPDYICVDAAIHDVFLQAAKKYIRLFYYEDNGKLRSDFPHIINEKHFAKVSSFLDPQKTVWGGKAEGLCLEPTVLDGVSWDDACMKEEIFGPIMPILSYDDLLALLQKIRTFEKPLAFYYFSRNSRKAKQVFSSMPFGGGCFNETIMHLTNDTLPFGGVGESGMGHYHGPYSFHTFSHEKPVLSKGHFETTLRYPPHSAFAMKVLEKMAHLKDHGSH